MEFPNWSLNEKVAIVTGASRGLGHAIALAYANAGAGVVLASRDEERLKEVSDEISQMGRKALHKRTDITKEEYFVLKKNKYTRRNNFSGMM